MSKVSVGKSSITDKDYLKNNTGSDKKLTSAVVAKKVAYWVGSFLLPISLFVFVSIAANVYPFGTNSFLTEDLKYQYIDFFAWFQNVLSGEASIFYSSAQALGTNTWGLFSYYLSSPFNLLVVFFDEYHLTDFVYLITALKLGCIQVSMTIFLKKRFGLSSFAAMLLALCFVWSSWTASQLRNPLWLDSLIVLPILCLAAYRFVNNDQWKLLLASLVASILVCWYIAYMSIIFVSLYLVVEYYLAYLEDQSSFSYRVLRKKIAQYIGLLILALLLCAWTFLPTVLGMIGDSSTERIGVESQSLLQKVLDHKGLLIMGVLTLLMLSIFYSWLIKSRRISARAKVSLAVASVVVICLCMILISRSIFPNITTGSSKTIILGMFFGTWETYVTQLFAGTVVLILLLLFILSREIDLRIRIAVIALLLFLILSTWINPLYVFWCGMRQPNGFYCRISEFAILIMVWIAAYYLAHVAKQDLRVDPDHRTEKKSLQASNKKSTISGFRLRDLVIACSVLFLVVLLFIGLGCYRNTVVGIVSAIVVVFDGVLLLFLLRGDRKPFAPKIGLLALLFVELLLSAYLIWAQLYVGYSQSQVDTYNHEARAQWEAISESDDSAYRFNRTYRRAEPCSFNEGMAIGFDELSSYSSVHNGDAVKFLSAVGFSREGEFSVGYDTSLLVPESLLGCKYLTSEGHPFGYERTSYPTANRGSYVYENPYALPLGYGSSMDIKRASLDNTNNPFERQNVWISALLGENVKLYQPVTSRVVSEDTSEGDMISRQYSVDIPAESVVYAYVSTHSNVQATVSIDGKSYLENERFNQAPILVTNSTQSNESKNAVLTKDESYSGQNADELRESPNLHEMDLVFYSLNMSTFKDAISRLSANPFNISTFEDGRIEGTFTKTKEDETLLLTVPCEDGWSVKVNGQDVEPESVFDGAMMSIPVEMGENTIEMSFVSPGFIPGCAITAVSLIGLVCLLLSGRRKKQRV